MEEPTAGAQNCLKRFNALNQGGLQVLIDPSQFNVAGWDWSEVSAASSDCTIFYVNSHGGVSASNA